MGYKTIEELFGKSDMLYRYKKDIYTKEEVEILRKNIIKEISDWEVIAPKEGQSAREVCVLLHDSVNRQFAHLSDNRIEKWIEEGSVDVQEQIY